MAENSKIEWCHHTFNPWVGCTKVSAACDYCYAESWAKRSGHPELWAGERRRTRPANWAMPFKWNKAAKLAGERHRVFCASLADVFDNQVPEAWRHDLFTLIAGTPELDWLLLTKRPQNIAKMLPDDWDFGYANVWLGTTVENQEEADRRIASLLTVPSVVHFLSCEPLLGPIKMPPGTLGRRDPARHKGTDWDWIGINWVIAGGESGPHHRKPDSQWFRDLRDECEFHRVPFLFKQWGGRTPKAGGRELDGVIHDGYPVPSPERSKCPECGGINGVPNYDSYGLPCPVCGTEDDFNRALAGEPSRTSPDRKGRNGTKETT